MRRSYERKVENIPKSGTVRFVASVSTCVVAVCSGVMLKSRRRLVNNTVPPTVQSVSVAHGQRARSGEEKRGLWERKKTGPEATQGMCAFRCVHAWN